LSWSNVKPRKATISVIMDENNAHDLAAFSFLKKNNANPLTKGITMNRTGIISYLSIALFIFLRKTE
jgi:hypothetical protein